MFYFKLNVIEITSLLQFLDSYYFAYQHIFILKTYKIPTITGKQEKVILKNYQKVRVLAQSGEFISANKKIV